MAALTDSPNHRPSAFGEGNVLLMNRKCQFQHHKINGDSSMQDNSPQTCAPTIRQVQLITDCGARKANEMSSTNPKNQPATNDWY